MMYPYIPTAYNKKVVNVSSVQADFYFSKPVSMELLLLNIRNIFEQKQKLKDRYVKDHHAEAKELVHSAKDKAFMEELLAIIDEQLSNPELDVELICTTIGMSRTKLYQKIKSITGQATADFVRTIRLRKAVEIMTHEDVPWRMSYSGWASKHSLTLRKLLKRSLGKRRHSFCRS